MSVNRIWSEGSSHANENQGVVSSDGRAASMEQPPIDINANGCVSIGYGAHVFRRANENQGCVIGRYGCFHGAALMLMGCNRLSIRRMLHGASLLSEDTAP